MARRPKPHRAPLHHCGQTPVPTIRARVGNTLIVRLRNRLPEPTCIHWHGLRDPADMDGTKLVQPAEVFEDRFQLLDT
ncbi:MAG: multicopper oxidase type 3 [Propionibacteriaceae bacterium]|nr:multicopper oxidase type 3 [Propionibacteriaceae bacterium]